MIDPFEPEQVSEEEMIKIFHETLDRCDKEVDIIVKAIDDIGDTVTSIKDKMSCIEYKALRTTVLTLVAEKLDFCIGKLD